MWIRLTALCLMGVCAGCTGDTGPKRWHVTGTVELPAGAPVNGSISFLPSGGHKGPAANGAVREGKFDIPQSEGPTAGSHQVVISLVAGKMAADFAKGSSGKTAGKRTRWEFKSEVSATQTEFDFTLEE